MATTNENTYSGIFGALNPHLHTAKTAVESITDPIRDVYTIELKAPKFIGNSTDIRQFIKNSKSCYGFTDAVFEDHTLNYATHQVIEKPLTSANNTSIINVFYQWGGGYYHFLTEVLPNALEICHDISYSDIPIFLNPCKFAEPILRWFGLTNPVLTAINKTAYTSEIIQPIIECGNPSPRKIQLIRDVIGRKLTFRQQIGIIIYRKEQRRRILNFDAVCDMMRKCFPDIKWVVFDSMSFEHTIQFFSRAKIIFAPHGAGLINTLFAPKGTVIYEINPIEHPNLCYYHISELLENTHYIIPHHVVNNSMQFMVDIPYVTGLIKNTIK